MIKGIKSVLGFLTTIPMDGDISLEEAAKYMWLFPIVGAFIAFLAACVEYFVSLYLSAYVSSALAIFALLLLTGFHHLDGLLDFGDAVMHRGSVESRQKVLHDVNTGVGGFALGFFVLFITCFALVDSYNPFISLIIAETSAKFSMVLGAYVGRASHEGMGSIFTKNVGRKQFLLSLILYLLVLAMLLEPLVALRIFLGSMLSSIVVLHIANKALGGVSGDVFGAMNEITRMANLVVLI